jgi:hypothetical protein
MRIGIDFDSTITKHPEFFSEMTSHPDHECFVITARPEGEREYVEGYLKNHDIRVKRVCMITEDLARADDRAYIQTVFREKPKLCKELKIEVMYDDDLRILNHLIQEVPGIIPILVL